MQEGMKGNKIPNQTKTIFLPLLHTLLAQSTGAQTPENPSLLEGSAIQPLWSHTRAGSEMTKGLSPTYSSPAPSLASPRATAWHRTQEPAHQQSIAAEPAISTPHN